MKYLVNLYWIGCLLIGLHACRQDRQLEKEALPVTPLDLDSVQALAWSEMATEYLLAYPDGIILTDSHLIIQDRNSGTYLFHGIDRRNGRVDFEFAKKGNGPREWMDATQNASWNPKGNILSFYDPAKRTVFSFQANGAEAYTGFGYVGASRLNCDVEYVRELAAYQRGFIAMGEHGRFGKHRFMELDRELQPVKSSGEYPPLRSLLTDPEADERQLLFATASFKISPDGTKAAFASYKGALLQFFDLVKADTATLIQTRQLERPIKKEQVSDGHDGWVYGFDDIFLTNAHVYAIYNGQTAEENEGLGKYIIMYDWEGNPCKVFQSEYSLTCLAVDEEQHIIYAVAYTAEKGFFLVMTSMNSCLLLSPV